jgi:hypothetical protein
MEAAMAIQGHWKLQVFTIMLCGALLGVVVDARLGV